MDRSFAEVAPQMTQWMELNNRVDSIGIRPLRDMASAARLLQDNAIDLDEFISRAQTIMEYMGVDMFVKGYRDAGGEITE